MRIIKRGINIIKDQGLNVLVQKILLKSLVLCSNITRTNFVQKIVIKKFKKIIESYSSIEDYYDKTNIFKFLDLDFRSLQIREEILNLLYLIKSIKPKVIVEIGTNKGGTLNLFSLVSSKYSILISIDLPKGEFGGGYPSWKIPIYKSFAKDQQKIYLIRGNSHLISTKEELERILDGQNIDFLFIDGDHTYKGVSNDFFMYSDLVKKSGIIAFHDIVEHERSLNVGVKKFWDEIKVNYKNKEFVKDWNQKSCGIGVIWI